MFVEDGSGKGNSLKIDGNLRAHTHSVSAQEEYFATDAGKAYNINSGNLTLTGDGTLLYLKNNEDVDLVIRYIAIAEDDTNATHSSDPYATVYSNPTGGDLISDATAAAFNSNRNFGFNAPLDSDIYTGKTGGTITGGTGFGILKLNRGARNEFDLNIQIPPGRSMAIDLAAGLSAGSAIFNITILCYIRDPESSNP